MIFKGDKNLWTLLDFKFSRHFKAEHGGDGSKNRSTGADGKDCVIRVPLGTVIVDNDSGEKLTEIVDEKEVVAIKGGKGGRVIGISKAQPTKPLDMHNQDCQVRIEILHSN